MDKLSYYYLVLKNFIIRKKLMKMYFVLIFEFKVVIVRKFIGIYLYVFIEYFFIVGNNI